MLPMIRDRRLGPMNFKQLSRCVHAIKRYCQTGTVEPWIRPLGNSEQDAIEELILQIADQAVRRHARYRRETELLGISDPYEQLGFEQDRPQAEWPADPEEPLYRKRTVE